MSPRNDTYLSLCLAQAELSPLLYRHGSIIVRGGKVIGQGFNSYRPGFDGGALKTGNVAASSLDGPAIAELKQRLRSNSKRKPKSQRISQDSGTLSPVESQGQGHNCNTPLSMHSEMMAIQSALSLSSGTLSSHTSARSTKIYQNPCFSLPGDSKMRKQRARALQTYAQAVLAEVGLAAAVPSGASSGFHEVERDAVAVNAGKGSTSRPHGLQYRSHHKCGSEPHQYKNMAKERSTSIDTSSSDDDAIRPAKVKTRAKKSPVMPPKSEQILITKDRTTMSRPSLAARTKDLRLKGSDLYVARLGSCTPAPKPRKTRATPKKMAELPLPPPTQSPPQSCYDELSSVSRTPSAGRSQVAAAADERPEIRPSRPCYRCVAAMHAVGIKRVFWTNAEGGWDGAKVRDLVEALEGGGGVEGVENAGDEKGIFVTTHEVLMMQKVMGF